MERVPVDREIVTRFADHLRGTNGHLWGRPATGTTAKYLLTELVRCGACGGGMIVKTRAHGRKRSYRYACSWRDAHGQRRAVRVGLRVRPESVTHVSGIRCNPSLRNEPIGVWRPPSGCARVGTPETFIQGDIAA